jgi:hypothetical protein
VTRIGELYEPHGVTSQSSALFRNISCTE